MIEIPIIRLVAAPLVGGVIGYITNSLAIRMLFRPHYEKHIFGKRIPFTPGIIPKEKGRIAESIGKAISENLMNKEVLEKNLLSDEMLDKLGNAVDGFFAKQSANEESLREFLLHYISEQELGVMAHSTQTELTEAICHKLADSNMGDRIAVHAVEYVIENVGIIVIPMVVRLLRESVQRRIATAINDLLQQHSWEIVGNLVCGETENLLSCKVCRLLNGKEEQMAKVKGVILTIYRKLIEEQLPKILDAVDISRIVKDRINAMPVEEAEELIMQVMHKELKAIVWLGALLGMMMGFVNVFW